MQISIEIVPVFRTLRNLFPLKSAKDLWVKIHSATVLNIKVDLTVSCKGKHNGLNIMLLKSSILTLFSLL